MEYATKQYTVPETHTNARSGKRGRTIRFYVLLSAAIGMFLMILLYLVLGLRYGHSFYPKTVINGVDASGLTPEELVQKISEKAENYSLTLKERDHHTECIEGGRIGLHVDITAEKLEKLLEKQSPALWIFQIFGRKEYQAGLQVVFDEALLRRELGKLDCMDSEKMTAPADAYAVYVKDSGYTIVPEVMGNKVRKKKLLGEVTEALCTFKDSLSLETMECYDTPEIRESDEGLREKVRVLNRYIGMEITYRFDDRREILDGVQISKWIWVARDGKVSVDEKQIQKYVKKLADTYDTAYKSREFKTSYGPVVRIDQGDYGYQIDQKEETKALKKIVLSGKSRTREPVYIQRGVSHGAKDYGDTYVELNLLTQHLFLYDKGKLVLETDFVSGNVAGGNATPCGIYGITYKQRNAVLKGADYRSEVSYWMPFNRGIGLHDADWRTRFGGDIYKNNGSHGCVNLPPDKAKRIYETVEKGTPVICYRLNPAKKKRRKH